MKSIGSWRKNLNFHTCSWWFLFTEQASELQKLIHWPSPGSTKKNHCFIPTQHVSTPTRKLAWDLRLEKGGWNPKHPQKIFLPKWWWNSRWWIPWCIESGTTKSWTKQIQANKSRVFSVGRTGLLSFFLGASVFQRGFCKKNLAKILHELKTQWLSSLHFTGVTSWFGSIYVFPLPVRGRFQAPAVSFQEF